MPARRLSKTENSSVRHRRSLTRLRASAVPVMRSCKQCKDSKSSCEVGKDSDKCVRCVAFGCKCDLAISEAEWNRIQRERTRLRDRVRNAANEVQEVTVRTQEATARLQETTARLV